MGHAEEFTLLSAIIMHRAENVTTIEHLANINSSILPNYFLMHGMGMLLHTLAFAFWHLFRSEFRKYLPIHEIIFIRGISKTPTMQLFSCLSAINRNKYSLSFEQIH